MYNFDPVLIKKQTNPKIQMCAPDSCFFSNKDSAVEKEQFKEIIRSPILP